MKNIVSTRTKEIEAIQRAKKAAAVGRLMLAELDSWVEFDAAENQNLYEMPRRKIKAENLDVKKHLSKEIKKFCTNNFLGMNADILARMYDDIKKHNGLEVPLEEFEEKYSKLKPKTLKRQPRHSTVVISLWGLQFKYPESFLAHDITESLNLLKQSEEKIRDFRNLSHNELTIEKENVRFEVRKSEFASRACLISCCNLVEAFLNGTAWEFSSDNQNLRNLSERKRKLLKDGTLREKLLKYPTIIGGAVLWEDSNELVQAFLTTIKPFRDALVHPSPFNYNQHDKLMYFYRVDSEKAQQAARIATQVITEIHLHITKNSLFPDWLKELQEI